MVDAAPFRALRYDPDVAGSPVSTSAPAYDDLERFAYARHRTASPYTVLELLAAGRGVDGYRGAGAAFERWRRTGVLVTDDVPAYYLYEEHELRHGVPAVQRGVLAAVRVGDPDLLAHEDTDPARVAERVERLRAVPADLSPVFGVWTAAPRELPELLARPAGTSPILALTDEAGVDHRIWALRDPRRVTALRAVLSGVRAVIADGHHRYAAARALRGRHPGGHRTLAYLVDANHDGPQLLAVHRLVEPLPVDVEAALSADFEVRPSPGGPAELQVRLHRCPGKAYGLWLPGSHGLLLAARDEAALAARMPRDRSAVWRGLETAILEHAILPALHAAVVGYRSDATSAAAEVDAGAAAGLFLLRGVPTETVVACAEAGDPMPAKTTWFRPKPRAGLVLRALDVP